MYKICSENSQKSNKLTMKCHHQLYPQTPSTMQQFDKVPEMSFGLKNFENNYIKVFFYLFIYLFIFGVVCLNLCMFVCVHMHVGTHTCSCGCVQMFMWVHADFCVHSFRDQSVLPGNLLGCCSHFLRQGLSLTIELTLLIGWITNELQ